MNDYSVRRLALILAVQSEIEGMKSQNKIAELNNQMIIYDSDDFEAKAIELRNLAYAHDEQL
jgi:hypothetical protein